MSGSVPELRAGDAGADAAPDEALAAVWVLLDELPRGTASAALASTTIEMAAVGLDAASRGGAAGRPLSAVRAWLVPAAVVAAALVVGGVAGRVTAPDPDRLLIENLPLVRHLDLLREAGSVTFLEAAAGRGGPPLRMALRQGPEAARQDAAGFNTKLESLDSLEHADTAARREFVAALPVEEQAELERSLREFRSLSVAERKTLAAVAAALVAPERHELRNAARDWHRWLASSRPEDRDDIIASNTDKRLEWIDWYAARIEGRGRPGPPDRPPPGRRPRDVPPRPFRPDRPSPQPETPPPPG